MSSPPDLKMSEFPLAGPIDLLTDYVPLVRLVGGVPENLLAAVADLAVRSGGGGGGAVNSVFGRSGNVLAAVGDYNWNQIIGPALPVVSGANLTNLNANAITAGTLGAGRLPGLTGDVLATAGSNVTAIGVGRVLNTMLAGGITAGKLVLTDITKLGTITLGVWQGTPIEPAYLNIDFSTLGTITSGVWHATPIEPAYGGTGLTTYAVGDLIYATAAATLAKLAAVVAGNALISGGVGAAPAWGKVGLTTHVSGVLAAPNGGTGLGAYTIGDLVYATATDALGKLAAVATGNALISGGVGAAPAWGKIDLTTNVVGVLPQANGGTGSSTVLTPGSVVFAGAGGAFSQNNSKFFWDNAAGNLGLGLNAPNAALDVLSATGNNLRLTYTAGTVYSELNTTASGILNLTATKGSINFATLGNQIDPAVGYKENLGSLGKKYLSVHAAELVVETLVAQGTIATIGGRILVGPTTTLTADCAAAATSITVKHNQMSAGDIVVLQAGGKLEFMLVTGGPTGAGPYTYTVTRNLDGTGADQWFAGDAVFNTGQAGSGSFIDLYSLFSLKNAAGPTVDGPTIVGNVRTGSSYNAWAEHWAIGNLKGLYGYGATTYGVGLGQYLAGAAHITIDPSFGLRMFAGLSTLRLQLAVDGSGFLANSLISWNTSGNLTVAGNATIGGWTITSNAITNGIVKIAAGPGITNAAGVAEAWFGYDAASTTGGCFFKGTAAAYLLIGSGNANIGTAGRPFLYFADGSKTRLAIGELNYDYGYTGEASVAMGIKLWSAAGSKLLEFSDTRNMIAGWTIDTTTISSTGVVLKSGASAGLAFGTTPPTSAVLGTGIWLDQTGLYGLLANVVQTKLDAVTGALLAGGGNAIADASGFYVKAAAAFSGDKAFRVVNSGGATLAAFYDEILAADNHTTYLHARNNAGMNANLDLKASAPTGFVGQVFITCEENAAQVRRISMRNAIGITFEINGNAMLTIDPNNNVVVSNGALAVGATNGFLYIPSMPGAPSGVPTAKSGRVPMTYDSTNNQFYIYNGAWKKVALT